MNEDANSSLYTIDPDAWRGSQVQHYAYNEPLPHKGGTDAISVYHGRLLISASAPGTTGTAAPNAAYPAAYTVSLDARTHVATVSPLFGDEAKATVANAGSSAGKTVSLALTDPDSNEIVPPAAPRFDVVTGPFRPGTAFVAVTPCGSNSAPATCPAAPAFPANYLGTLNMSTARSPRSQPAAPPWSRRE